MESLGNYAGVNVGQNNAAKTIQRVVRGHLTRNKINDENIASTNQKGASEPNLTIENTLINIVYTILETPNINQAIEVANMIPNEH